MKKKDFVTIKESDAPNWQSIKMIFSTRFHRVFSSKQRFLRIALSFLLLVIGGLIYIGYREQSLVMFNWVKSLGLNDNVANFRDTVKYHHLYDWAIYSLPDGLWLFAYMFCIDAIWNGEKSRISYILIFILPFFALLSEILQYYGFISGVFDWIDIYSYILAILLFLFIKILK